MTLDVRRAKCRGLERGLVGACVAALMLGCAGVDRELLEDWFDGRGHGHPGGGHGQGGNGGGAGGSPGDCGFISSDQVWRSVAADLRALDAEDQPFARYLTLANEFNAGTCGAALDPSRAALEKLVNSVSTSTTLSRLVAVEANLTLYRLDLRDYDWDRSVEVGGASFSDAWEAIVGSSPYAVPFVGADADDVNTRTGASVAVLLGDAFVAAAATAPLYYALLDIPEDVDGFVQDDLGIDVEQNRIDEEAVRAGLGGTGISASEFLVERHDLAARTGVLWQIFSDEGGAEALLDDPLSTPPSEERELTFTLPNGLLAHVLAGEDGQRSDDSALTLDTGESNFRATIARSYTKFRAQGVTPIDQLLELVLADPDRFELDELEQIRSVYPSAAELALIARSDFEQTALALANLGIDPGVPDPIDAAFLAFERDVDAARAAAALYVSTDDLLTNLILLDPALSVLDGGRIDRQDFDQVYAESLCILSVVNDNTVALDACQ